MEEGKKKVWPFWWSESVACVYISPLYVLVPQKDGSFLPEVQVGAEV